MLFPQYAWNKDCKQANTDSIQQEVRQMFDKLFAQSSLRALFAISLLGSHSLRAEQLRLIPSKNMQALTPENFCVGVGNVLKVSKQSFADEAAQLCPNGLPSATLKALVASPYAGSGQPNIITLNVAEVKETTTSNITVAYAMKIPKNAVKVLLGEEAHVSSIYKGENLTISAKFLPPPINLGEADTAFQIEQKTVVKDNVSFDDTSVHDLRLYRMFPNNFDMMMAVRTLSKPSEQFRKSVVVRGVMQDASNPDQALSFSVLSFSMNSRERHDRVIAAFSEFIKSDFMSLYSEQVKP